MAYNSVALRHAVSRPKQGNIARNQKYRRRFI